MGNPCKFRTYEVARASLLTASPTLFLNDDLGNGVLSLYHTLSIFECDQGARTPDGLF